MTKNIWKTDPGEPVETAGGGKVVGEYFGLHKSANEKVVGSLSGKTGTSAEVHVEQTIRLSLNEGVPFDGYLVSRRVDHVTLHIGMHPIYGLSAHIDRPTSHPDRKIEVIAGHEAKQVVISRNDFYSALLVEPISDAKLAEFVKRCWNV